MAGQWPCPLPFSPVCWPCPILISLRLDVSLRQSTTPSIKLQSSDREVFEVDVDIAKQSVPFQAMFEDLGMDDESGDDNPVPLKTLMW